jgi:hypothetical protein
MINKNELTQNRILADILPVIQKNCDISNAHHSGLFSICGLFLRLKDQYNWENNLPPWHPTDREKLLQWIDGKETLWLDYLDAPFEGLRINSRLIHYLNNQAVNRFLVPLGLYYGSGYGRGLKPTFFLGTVREKRLSNGYQIIILEKDLACDLSLSPAQRQGKTIIIRLDPLRFFLWSKIQETEQLEREGANMALRYYSWSPDLPPDHQLETLVRSEMETVLYHELGEALDRTFPQRLWRSLLGFFPFSRIELYLRTLKDLLADTHSRGTLPYIIREQKAGSLGFYLSNVRGLRQALFPEIVSAIREFNKKEDWSVIETARKEGRERMVGQAGKIKGLFEHYFPGRPEDFPGRFEETFYHPLGL